MEVAIKVAARNQPPTTLADTDADGIVKPFQRARAEMVRLQADLQRVLENHGYDLSMNGIQSVLRTDVAPAAPG